MLTSNRLIDAGSLDASKACIQIGSVKAYNAEQFGHVSQFVFEAAHSEGSKALSEDDFSKQQRKQIIFTTANSLPFAKTRVQVVKRTEMILTAADNAIRMMQVSSLPPPPPLRTVSPCVCHPLTTRSHLNCMQDRIAQLRRELEFVPPRKNSLMQVIQGSVVPMVNSGPVKICEIFLAQVRTSCA